MSPDSDIFGEVVIYMLQWFEFSLSCSFIKNGKSNLNVDPLAFVSGNKIYFLIAVWSDKNTLSFVSAIPDIPGSPKWSPDPWESLMSARLEYLD